MLGREKEKIRVFSRFLTYKIRLLNVGGDNQPREGRISEVKDDEFCLEQVSLGTG